jgi:hypothetical protein
MIDYKGISLAKMVKGNTVTFGFYRKGELWYNISVNVGTAYDNFQFPVPISEAGDGIFAAEDKATMFLRYIRKHLELIEDEKVKQNEEDNT